MAPIRTVGSTRWARITAGLLLLAGAGGAGFALGQANREPEQIADRVTATTVERTTTTRPTTTARPATTTTQPAPHPCDAYIGQEVTGEFVANDCQTTTVTVTPDVPDYEPPDAPTVETIQPSDDPYDYEPPATNYEPPPCRPSTITSCDPAEPMELPIVGCDYLEEDLFGDLRCVG